MKKLPTVDVAAMKPEDRYNHIVLHQRLVLTQQASFALDMIRMGFQMPIKPSGKNNRLMTPQEIVTRAVTIAELSYSALLSNGWIAEVPSFESLRDDSEATAGFVPRNSTK